MKLLNQKKMSFFFYNCHFESRISSIIIIKYSRQRKWDKQNGKLKNNLASTKRCYSIHRWQWLSRDHTKKAQGWNLISWQLFKQKKKNVLKLILISELWLKKMQLDALGDYRRCASPTQNWMLFPAVVILNHEHISY